MKVIMFGSGTFTPGDLPAGTIFSRSSLSALWAGSTTDGYDNLQWRAATDWSNGYYMRATLSDGTWGSGPAVLQDSSSLSGAQGFTGWNRTKIILARVNTSAIPNSATIGYVRIWVSLGGSPFRPDDGVYSWWEVIGSKGDPTSPIAGGASGTIGTYLIGGSVLTTFSSKLTTSPYGGVFSGEVLKATGWGLAQQPSSQGGEIRIYELGVEVGYDLAPYDVVTGDATNIATTTATVNGSVNPQGDSSASYWFEYGTSTSLGASTAPGSIVTGLLTNVSANLSTLSSGSVYYYRLVAQSSSSTKYYGAIRSFQLGGASLPIYVL